MQKQQDNFAKFYTVSHNLFTNFSTFSGSDKRMNPKSSKNCKQPYWRKISWLERTLSYVLDSCGT